MPGAVWWWIVLRNPSAPLQSLTPVDRQRNRWQVLLIGVFGVFLIAAPFYWGPPSLAELVPAEGTLVSYSFYRTSGRNSDLITVFKIAGQPGRFWNDAVKNGAASLLVGHVGQKVKVLYQPHARIAPMAGDAVKSYGLWINGEEVASAESSLELDRFLAYFFLPGLGLCSIGFAYWQIRQHQSTAESLSFPS
jgi:hypothetical protein